MKTLTGPVHTVENTWEADRDLLSAKENDWGMAPVSHYYYALNALGQRTAVEIDGVGTGSLVTWDWGYDAKGQVVKGDASSGSGATADDRFYDYDQIGNRKQSRTGTFTSTSGTATDYYANTAATTVGANGLNQYQAIKTGSVTRNPVHDDDGNLTDDGANWDYVWDGENRMISATPKSTSGTRKIIYKYDHLGRLSGRELQIWNGSAWAYHESYRYVYDGWNRIESCVNWMGLRDEYIWGLDLSGTPQGAGGVGGMLLWSTTYDYGANWKNYYPAYDGNGNVTELINGSGSVAAHWEYDPFGNILRSTAAGTWSDPVNLFEFRFSTKPQDRNTGLYYHGYRFYDPVAGRWASKDPIAERGGMNLYGFVKNNGVNSFDTLGMFAGPETVEKACKAVEEAAKRAGYQVAAFGETVTQGACQISSRAVIGAGGMVVAIIACTTCTTGNSDEPDWDLLPYPEPEPQPEPEPYPEPEPEPAPRPRVPLCKFSRHGNPFAVNGTALEHGGTDCNTCIYDCSDGTKMFIPNVKDKADCPFSMPPVPVGKPLLLSHPDAWDL